MAINFDGLDSGSTNQETVNAPNVASGLSINMEKNMTLDLTKRNPGLVHLKIGAGWDIASNGKDFDLDLFAFLLRENGKVQNVNTDVVFFNQMKQKGIELLGDNRTGVGEGDDEVITVDLASVESSVNAIVICIDIFKAVERSQTFGQVNNSYIRVINADNDSELCKFNLKEDFSVETAIICGKLVRNGSDWDFETIGEGKQSDISGLLNYFS